MPCENVLFLVSEWGYWGEELIGPLEACEKAGYKIEFCHADRRQADRAHRQHGPELRRSAAGPRRHDARDGREGPQLRRIGPDGFAAAA